MKKLQSNSYLLNKNISTHKHLKKKNSLNHTYGYVSEMYISRANVHLHDQWTPLSHKYEMYNSN